MADIINFVEWKAKKEEEKMDRFLNDIISIDNYPGDILSDNYTINVDDDIIANVDSNKISQQMLFQAFLDDLTLTYHQAMMKFEEEKNDE